MPRGISTATKNSLATGTIRPCLNIKLSFGGFLRLTTAHKDVVVSGEGTFLPTGGVLSVSEVRDAVDLSASNLTITLSGCSADLVNSMKNTQLQGLSVTIWLTFLDEDFNVIQNLHYFNGIIENTVYQQNNKTITIAVVCQNFLARLNERKVRRYTDADQKNDFPSDKALEYVEQIQEQSLVWGN